MCVEGGGGGGGKKVLLSVPSCSTEVVRNRSLVHAEAVTVIDEGRVEIPKPMVTSTRVPVHTVGQKATATALSADA